jgi:hypothetical protein
MVGVAPIHVQPMLRPQRRRVRVGCETLDAMRGRVALQCLREFDKIEQLTRCLVDDERLID